MGIVLWLSVVHSPSNYSNPLWESFSRLSVLHTPSNYSGSRKSSSLWRWLECLPPLWLPPEPRNEIVPPPVPVTVIYSSAYNPWSPGPDPNPHIACPLAYGYGLGANRASTYPYRDYTPVPVPYPGDYTYGDRLNNSPPHDSDDSHTQVPTTAEERKIGH